MSYVAFLNEKTESFENFQEEKSELVEELNFKTSPSEITIPKPICSEKEEWLSVRLEKCRVIFNFRSDAVEDINEKTECLEDLANLFRGDPGPMSRIMYSQIFDMLSQNLFRKIPQNTKRNIDPEEDSHQLEEAWTHVKLVYDIFIRFLEMSSLRLDYSKISMNDRFMHEMLELMDSDDPREREMAMTAVHRTYARFCTSRAFLRKEMSNILLKFIYDAEYFGGIKEILQIYSHIINGLSLPLSYHFLVFLAKVLVPLHKVENLSVFHHYLTVCLLNFVQKDSYTLKIIIEGLVKYWPKTNSQKEVLFLSEIEGLLEAVNSQVFREVQVPLFRRVAKCVLSPHFQVLERCLSMLNNEKVWGLVAEQRSSLLPILMPALQQTRRGHWSRTAAVLVHNVLAKFRLVDPPLFQHVIEEYKKPPPEQEMYDSELTVTDESENGKDI